MNIGVPSSIGPYVIDSILGVGGQGMVYGGYIPMVTGDTSSSRNNEVAIKVPFSSIDSRLVDDETRIGRMARSRNLVRSYGKYMWDGYPCIVMERVNGFRLDRLMLVRSRRMTMKPITAAEVVRQVAEGLVCLHAICDGRGVHMKVVHKDVKPINIIVSNDGVVRLLDFGAAYSAGMLFEIEEGQIRGTPAYVSPEQILGTNLDARSDIFSLGSILFELVVGSIAFLGTSFLTLMESIVKGEVDQLLIAFNVMSPELTPVLAKCWKRIPEDRYQSTSELACALRSKERELFESHGNILPCTLAQMVETRRLVLRLTQELPVCFFTTKTRAFARVLF